jgi:hypothetical protein
MRPVRPNRQSRCQTLRMIDPVDRDVRAASWAAGAPVPD